MNYYAIAEISGRQFWIEPGKYYSVNHIPLKPGTKFNLKKILLINQNKNIQIGLPYLKEVIVDATIIKHFDGQKIIVYKMKPKKKYRRKNGHRQLLTRILINNIFNYNI